MSSSDEFIITYPLTYDNPPAFGFETNCINAGNFYRINHEIKLKRKLNLPEERQRTTDPKGIVIHEGYTEDQHALYNTHFNEETVRAIVPTAIKIAAIVKILSYIPGVGTFVGLYRIYQAMNVKWISPDKWNEKKQAHIIRGTVELLSLGFAGPLFLILDIFKTVFDHCRPLKATPPRKGVKNALKEVGALAAAILASGVGGGAYTAGIAYAGITYSTQIAAFAVTVASLTTLVGWAIIAGSIAAVALIVLLGVILHKKCKNKGRGPEGEGPAGQPPANGQSPEAQVANGQPPPAGGSQEGAGLQQAASVAAAAISAAAVVSAAAATVAVTKQEFDAWGAPVGGYR